MDYGDELHTGTWSCSKCMHAYTAVAHDSMRFWNFEILKAELQYLKPHRLEGFGSLIVHAIVPYVLSTQHRSTDWQGTAKASWATATGRTKQLQLANNTATRPAYVMTQHSIQRGWSKWASNMHKPDTSVSSRPCRTSTWYACDLAYYCLLKTWHIGTIMLTSCMQQQQQHSIARW